ncbi:hypothetical protein SEPCBS119000_004529 [Sporothrix epigloea]|uniref:Uncharacterized protein n=1 Tax=Sporothrix epigloea TaxID=1892477 RepID=A0ABP0DWC9_9PEZI
MADMGASSATGGLPGIYTTSGASSHISLISETAATSASLSPPPYMGTGGSYPSSLHDHQQPSVFPASYQSQTYVPEYTTSSFPASNPPPLHAQYPRTAVNDQGLMYHLASPTSLSSSSIMHHHQPVPHHAQLPQPQLHQSQPHSVHRHGGHQVSPPVSVHAQAHNGANGHHTYEGVVSGGVCSTIGGPGAPGVRIVQNRPKPQCWEHGCNGRQFSTFSNLLRHQREKSGQAAKAVCPNCGAEFTRTTARNGHLQHDKCKPRRN